MKKKFKSICLYVDLNTVNAVNFTTLVLQVININNSSCHLFLLELFGTSLGTGDYGNLTIEHVPMLFRVHCSLDDLSNQGSEAAHKLQRQLYARATSHDSSGNTSLCKLVFNIYLNA